MLVPSLAEDSDHLMGVLANLHQRWSAARNVWTDAVSRGFEADFVSPIEVQTRAVAGEMEQLAGIVVQARRYVR